MIRRLIEWSLRNRLLVLLATPLLAGWGMYSAQHMALDAIPDLSDTQAIVKTGYPGQSPQAVEDHVTYPLASALLSVPGTTATTPTSCAVQDFYLKYELQSPPGVAEVASVGGMARQFQIEVNPYRLAAYRLSLEEVSHAVRDSNVSGDKSVAEMIREQLEAINAMNGEMAADAERAAKAVADSYKRASDLKMQADVVWLNSATAARLAVVDADEYAAQHAVDMRTMSLEQLLEQQAGLSNGGTRSSRHL